MIRFEVPSVAMHVTILRFRFQKLQICSRKVDSTFRRENCLGLEELATGPHQACSYFVALTGTLKYRSIVGSELVPNEIFRYDSWQYRQGSFLKLVIQHQCVY